MYRQAKKRSKQQGRVSTAGLPSLPPPKSRSHDTRSKQQRFLCRICGTQLSRILLVWRTKRSHFSCSSGVEQGDQTWHFAKRVTPWNTTSQRRRKSRGKSAKSCAATLW